MTRGISEVNMFTEKPYDPVRYTSKLEAAIATLPTGKNGARELWKLNHSYERLDEWNADHGIPQEPIRRRAGGTVLRAAQPRGRPRETPQPGRRRQGCLEPDAVGPQQPA